MKTAYMGLVFIASLAGCASKMSKTDLRPDLYGAPTTSIQIFTSRERVSKEYEELAVIVADDQGWEHTEARLTKDLVAEAQKIGADAVILMPTHSTSDTTIIASGSMITGVPTTTTKAKAIAIKWRSPK